MKIHDLKVYLNSFDENEELVIEVFETSSGQYIDSSADIVYAANVSVPTLHIDIETGKFHEMDE
jgi:hypothetical protein